MWRDVVLGTATAIDQRPTVYRKLGFCERNIKMGPQGLLSDKPETLTKAVCKEANA
jgi:hypothetical protein